MTTLEKLYTDVTDEYVNEVLKEIKSITGKEATAREVILYLASNDISSRFNQRLGVLKIFGRK